MNAMKVFLPRTLDAPSQMCTFCRALQYGTLFDAFERKNEEKDVSSDFGDG